MLTAVRSAGKLSSTTEDSMQVVHVQAEPLEGGSFVASGRLWVAPEAETDPRAVAVQGAGSDLPLDALVRRYLPPVRAAGQRCVHPGPGIFGGGVSHCCIVQWPCRVPAAPWAPPCPPLSRLCSATCPL